MIRARLNRREISTHDLTKRSTYRICHTRCHIFISTHDLTKRSTNVIHCLLSRHTNFNSRPHEEVDEKQGLLLKLRLIFQLTTSRRGRRQYVSYGDTDVLISTHDLTKRSTGWTVGVCDVKKISTHDLTKRSTNPISSHTTSVVYFNSRPHEEVDLFFGNWCR